MAKAIVLLNLALPSPFSWSCSLLCIRGGNASGYSNMAMTFITATGLNRLLHGVHTGYTVCGCLMCQNDHHINRLVVSPSSTDHSSILTRTTNIPYRRYISTIYYGVLLRPLYPNAQPPKTLQHPNTLLS